MSNLFSIFDPTAIMGVSMNWVSSILVIISLPNLFWLMKSQIISALALVTKFIHGEFYAITGFSMTPGGTFLGMALFFFIALNNFMGLFPYIFTSSSHLTFTIAMALPLWAGHMLMAWTKTPTFMLAHLVPLGTPYVLMPFMVLIELTSNLIRPLTLSVRLAANMVAGHLLLTLLSSQAPLSLYSVLTPLFLALILLTVLESAVALIQAYVFSVLSTLYVNEVNSNPMNN